MTGEVPPTECILSAQLAVANERLTKTGVAELLRRNAELETENTKLRAERDALRQRLLKLTVENADIRAELRLVTQFPGLEPKVPGVPSECPKNASDSKRLDSK